MQDTILKLRGSSLMVLPSATHIEYTDRASNRGKSDQIRIPFNVSAKSNNPD
uniref:Uncharacterized protein n=1 Tax=Rhizophagus irregularis (strain DAOM 181602 / DAOM 197198 / MUCL 43194) TaxID=747089 RepID=U9TWV7_RHIID